jgi:hypothetical protein
MITFELSGAPVTEEDGFKSSKVAYLYLHWSMVSAASFDSF